MTKKTDNTEAAQITPDPLPGTLIMADNQESGRFNALNMVMESADIVRSVAADNFPPDHLSRLRLESQARSPSCLALDTLKPDEEIEIQYYYVHPYQMNQRGDNSPNIVVRTVIFARDGRVFDSKSKTVAESIAAFVRAFGDAEIPAGIKVKLETYKAQRGEGHKLTVV